MRAFILALFLFFLCGCEITIRRSPRSDVSAPDDVVFSPASFKTAPACKCDPPCASNERCYSDGCKPIAARARARTARRSEV